MALSYSHREGKRKRGKRNSSSWWWMWGEDTYHLPFRITQRTHEWLFHRSTQSQIPHDCDSGDLWAIIFQIYFLCLFSLQPQGLAASLKNSFSVIKHTWLIHSARHFLFEASPDTASIEAGLICFAASLEQQILQCRDLCWALQSFWQHHIESFSLLHILFTLTFCWQTYICSEDLIDDFIDMKMRFYICIFISVSITICILTVATGLCDSCSQIGFYSNVDQCLFSL